jgi:phosphate butyryltransferase
MIRTFADLFKEVKNRPRKTLVVPAAEGASIMLACADACRQGICEVILLGDLARLESLADENGIPRDLMRLEHVADHTRAVQRAIELVRDGQADLLMKGKTDTPTLLKAVLDGETGLRTGRVLSHVAVMEMAAYPRLMLVSDGGLNIRPDVDVRKDIIRNAVEVAHRLGVARPGVALLSAMEKVNPKMEETLDYDAIVKEQQASPFVEAVIEGPLAMDLALSREAARIKGVESAVAGETDIFVVPEISTANIFVKALIYLAGAKVGGLIVGARVPIVLLSRADDAETKLRSIALGACWN